MKEAQATSGLNELPSAKVTLQKDEKKVPLKLLILAPALAFGGGFIVGLFINSTEEGSLYTHLSSTENLSREAQLRDVEIFDEKVANSNWSTTLADMEKNQNWKVAKMADQLKFMNLASTFGKEYAEVFIDGQSQQITLGYSLVRFGNVQTFNMGAAEKSLVVATIVYNEAIRNPEGFKNPTIRASFELAAKSVLPSYFPEDK